MIARPPSPVRSSADVDAMPPVALELDGLDIRAGFRHRPAFLAGTAHRCRGPPARAGRAADRGAGAGCAADVAGGPPNAMADGRGSGGRADLRAPAWDPLPDPPGLSRSTRPAADRAVAHLRLRRLRATRPRGGRVRPGRGDRLGVATARPRRERRRRGGGSDRSGGGTRGGPRRTRRRRWRQDAHRVDRADAVRPSIAPGAHDRGLSRRAAPGRPRRLQAAPGRAGRGPVPRSPRRSRASRRLRTTADQRRPRDRPVPAPAGGRCPPRTQLDGPDGRGHGRDATTSSPGSRRAATSSATSRPVSPGRSRGSPTCARRSITRSRRTRPLGGRSSRTTSGPGDASDRIVDEIRDEVADTRRHADRRTLMWKRPLRSAVHLGLDQPRLRAVVAG